MARGFDLDLVVNSYDSENPASMLRFLVNAAATYGEVCRTQYVVNGSLNIDFTVANFTTINYFMLYNRNTTSYATITYTSTGGGASRIVRVPASTVCVLGDVAPASGVSLNRQTGDVVVDVLIVGD